MARGPKPKYQPTFSEATLIQCRFLVRQRTLPFAHRQRAQMVLLLHEDPTRSHVDIAQRVGCHPNTVRHWRKVWATEKFRLGELPRAGRPPTFTAAEVTQIKAVACELPAKLNLPLSRFSRREIQRYVLEEEIVTTISPATMGRLLRADVIQPWSHHSWIFVRDPDFLAKAGPVLDLYQGFWEGRRLGAKEYVLCADEKTSIQARARLVGTRPAIPGHPLLVEHEYERMGAIAMLTAWDVHRGQAFSVYVPQTGKDSFRSLVSTIMAQEPYASADGVHWIVDNGSSHPPGTFGPWLEKTYPNAKAHPLPVHARWLNQVEIFFSIVPRQVLTPNDFADLHALVACLVAFHERYNATAQPFRWKFTRDDWAERLRQLA